MQQELRRLVGEQTHVSDAILGLSNGLTVCSLCAHCGSVQRWEMPIWSFSVVSWSWRPALSQWGWAAMWASRVRGTLVLFPKAHRIRFTRTSMSSLPTRVDSSHIQRLRLGYSTKEVHTASARSARSARRDGFRVPHVHEFRDFELT